MAKTNKKTEETVEKKKGTPPAYRLVARKRGSERGKGYLTLLAGWVNSGKFGDFTTFSKDNRITDDQLAEILIDDLGKSVKEREYTVFLQVDTNAKADGNEDASDFNFSADE